MTYIEIGGQRYEAAVTGKLRDADWGNRETKAIRLHMSHEAAVAAFGDDVPWNIVYIEEDGTESVYDNSEFSLAGPITDHRNGSVTVKMAKPSAEDVLAILTGEV